MYCRYSGLGNVTIATYFEERTFCRGNFGLLRYSTSRTRESRKLKRDQDITYESRGRLRSEAKHPHAPLRQSYTNTPVLIKTALLSGQLVGAARRSDSYKLERNILDGQNALPGFSERNGF